MPQSVRQMSCCQITKSVIFNEMGRPAENGLYDRRMGPLENLET